MKSIVLFSPILINRKAQSGINFRLLELEKWFLKQGFRTIVSDKINPQLLKAANVYYIMISSKKDSISSQLIKKIPKEKILIVDLYTPLLLEKRASLTKINVINWINYSDQKRKIKSILNKGNHFIIVNKRQKKYWQRAAKGMGVEIKSSNISILPTGAPRIKVKALPIQKRKVILWFGGIYPWLEPQPLIEAFSQIASTYPEWKLRVLGAFQPGTGYHSRYNSVITIAKKKIPKGQLDIIPWIPPNTLPKYLKDVSFAIHLPRESEEDYYSHRIRILTLLNAKIPLISSGKDTISNILFKEQAGMKASSNAKQLSIEIEELIKDKKIIKKWIENTQRVEKYYIKTHFDMEPLLKLFKKEKII